MLYNIRDFGAVGDGITLDSAAIQRAVNAVRDSGSPGTVVIPQGEYRCGSIECVSDLTIQFEPGARLVASDNIADFSERKEYTFLSHYFFGAFNCKNLTFQGNGLIDGNGFAFWHKDYCNGSPAETFVDPAHENNVSFPLRPHSCRPVVMMFVECENIVLRDFTVINGAAFTIWPLACSHVRIENLDIKNYRQGPNSDALDIDSCSDVFISNCRLDAGDDCIALKTSHYRLEKPRPCERICVSNCILSSPTCGIRVGFEGDAPIRDCVFSNLVIYDSGHGVDMISVTAHRTVMTIEHGCDIENIAFSNIVMRNVKAALYLRAGRFGAVAAEQPAYRAHIKDITFSGITAYTMDASFIGSVENFPHCVENITLRDITLHCERNERSRPAEHFTKPHWEISSPDALDLLNVENLFISNLRITGGELRGAGLQNVLSDVKIIPIDEKYLDFLAD